ncbi:hypothetical protein WS75_11580 [Burkholderia sp. FL-7-2-10-S1-D7]|uniref:hypothetical protein n=1 Tax=Burkholderia sp. FL-7-2-10-S1-D7 TaxID=1637866 RepID=UPI00075A213C|nr:hypothetical protein [Burkholderia sp. FL-7-2-10-S1-D7]KVF76586.1 hypothetical protein WS75_11580 [Burkholderia sp. FL-7-2-10-S1-D7]
MRKQWTSAVLAVLMCLPVAVSAQEVSLTGKTQSNVTAKVVKRNVLDVTDDKGGWFAQGIEMQQFGGWESPYEAQARLRVVSTTGRFQVRMDQPLQIVNQEKPSVVFQKPTISMGEEGAGLKLLAVDRSVEFQNPAAPSPNIDSEGYYNLAVSAYPPAGDFRSTAGTYTGTLSLTFEPVVVAP